MRHPWLCGLLLAFALILAQVLTVPVDIMTVYRNMAEMIVGADVPMGGMVLAAGIVVGAFAASMPERLRRRDRPRGKLSPGRCGACFAGGIFAAIGCGLAEGGFSLLLLTGSMTGTVSGLAFAAVVLLSGCLAAVIAERRSA